MINYKFGDIILVPFPFTDQTAVKKRPAVIISSYAYQLKQRDVIIMAITSQIKERRSYGEVLIENWNKSGLPKPSIVKPIITTIEKELVIKKLGGLNNKDKDALLNSLQMIINDNIDQ